MRTEATVISTDGKLAKVRVVRSSMCDGCEKNTCNGSCSAASLMGADKTVNADADNSIGASVGDKVIVETSDCKILGFAALVFIFPIVICAVAYATAFSISSSERISVISALLSFVVTFAFIGAFERRIRGRRSDIVISEIIGRE